METVTQETVKTSLELPRTIWAQVSGAATEDGVSKQDFVAAALEEKLERRATKKGKR